MHLSHKNGNNQIPNAFFSAPIFYVNGAPHLGHLYTSIAVDVMARFRRMIGGLTYVSVGTDEHGQKVAQSASEAKESPQKFVDRMYIPFLNLVNKCEMKYDIFIRTTYDEHKKVAQHFYEKLVKSKYVYEGEYEGWYSSRDEAFYADTDVKDGKALNGSKVTWVKEKCMFFALSKFKDKLLKYYQENIESILPYSRYQEVMGMLNANLPDLAITRTRFSWGIPIEQLPGHVLYVWVDALTNYLTVLGYPNNEYQMKKWWPNSVHVIGKDILKFHAIYWPAMLMAVELQPPKKIVAHGWWTVNGHKMSKSEGNVIDPFALIDEYGVDEIRYLLMTEMSFGQDGDFNEKRMNARLNSDLCNELGNFIQRVMMFCYKEYEETLSLFENLTNVDIELLNQSNAFLNSAIKGMENAKIHIYLSSLRSLVRLCNVYIDEQKPWKLSGENRKRVLSVLCEMVKRVAIFMEPIMPLKAKSVFALLGYMDNLDKTSWNELLKVNKLQKPEPMFTSRGK